MSDSETLLKILETVTQSQERLVEVLARMEERQQEHAATLTTRTEVIQQRTEAIDAHIAADHRALVEILKYIAEVCTRSEQMTARILLERDQRGPAQ